MSIAALRAALDRWGELSAEDRRELESSLAIGEPLSDSCITTAVFVAQRTAERVAREAVETDAQARLAAGRVEVGSCWECPLQNEDGGSLTCNHPEARARGEKRQAGGQPHWCPLRSGALVVKLGGPVQLRTEETNQ